MKKVQEYICSECGYISKYWLGRCPNCQNWDTFIFNQFKTQKNEDEKDKIQNGKKPLRIDQITSTT
ncbi:MAG: DNA repair protein RadA, partial [bacterium]